MLMSCVRVLLLGAALAAGAELLGAGKPSPTPAPGGAPVPAVPGVKLADGAAAAALRPFIADLAPRRLHALSVLTVRGGNFGKDVPGRVLSMRMGGNGFGAALDVKRWTPTEVDVVIPKGVPAGRYYVGAADARRVAARFPTSNSNRHSPRCGAPAFLSRSFLDARGSARLIGALFPHSNHTHTTHPLI